MPYCTRCGTQVGETDRFCARCGAAQQAGGPVGGLDILNDVNPRTLSILCYTPLLGWIACLAVLASRIFQQDRIIRFHAFQGLYLFVTWLIIDWAVGPLFRWHGSGMRFEMDSILKLAVIGMGIFMMVKTSQNQVFRLPLLGELAERSLAEQR